MQPHDSRGQGRRRQRENMTNESMQVLEHVNTILDDLLEDYQRRQDQAILQQDLYKANYAMAGKETCKEVKRVIAMRLEMRENMVREIGARKRA